MTVTGFVVLLGALGAFLAGNARDLPAGWKAVRGADVRYLLVAGAATVGLLGAHAWAYSTTQRLVGLQATAAGLLRPAMAAAFLNAVIKGGMAGLAPLLGHARRHGQPRAQVLASYMLVSVLGELTFAVMLIATLITVSVDGHLSRTEVYVSVAFAALLLLKLIVIAGALRSHDSLARLWSLPARTWARVTRRPVPAGPPPEDEDRFAGLLQAVRAHPGTAARCAGATLAVDLLGIVELWAVLHALHLRPAGTSIAALALIAYTVGVVFAIVGILPSGLGFVEVSVGATLGSFGVPGPRAGAAVVLYRLFELWLPLVAGGLALLTLRRKGEASG